MKYVLFDLDGTLTDPAEGITNSIAYALRAQDIPVPPYEKLCEYIGPPIINSFMNDFDMTVEEAYETLRLYRVYFEGKGMFENFVYDGMYELLAMLKDRGYTLAVATSKPEPYARQIIAHYGMDKYFTFVGGSRMDETRVAKDEVIAYVMEELGIADSERDDVTMVGDRAYDVMGAKKCGIHAVGVSYGYGTEGEFDALGADYIVSDVGELGEVLTK